MYHLSSFIRTACLAALLSASACTLHAKSIYFIGNSVTDTVNYNGFKKLTESRGGTQPWGRHMIPGAPLVWLWTHPAEGFMEQPYGYPTNALPNYDWDVLTLQPFDRHLDGAEGDTTMTTNYLGLLTQRAANTANTQVYIYARWPRTSDGEYSAQWVKKYTGGWDSTNETKDYFEKLTTTTRAQHPELAKSIKMIPVGHVMYSLDLKMAAGQVPGYTDIYEMYADGIHLKGVGAYLCAITFYATIYKESPVGLPVPSEYGAIDAGLVSILQTTTWEVVSTHPLAGVSDSLPLTVETLALPAATQGAAYSTTLTALNVSGGTATWAITSGTLPTGLALATGTGIISGTPSQPGAFAITVRVTDGAARTASKSLNLTVNADTVPVIATGAALPTANRAKPYRQQLAASGGDGALAWSITAGTLPIGMSLLSDGTLLGAPGLEGTYTFTARVTDSDATPDSANRAFTLEVGAAESNTIFVNKASAGVISVDGLLNETVWPRDFYASKVQLGAANNTVSFGVLWDASYLYIGVRVLDATVQGDSAAPENDDSVEIYIDGLHDREAVYNSDDRQFYVGPGGLFLEPSGRGAGVLAATVLIAGGYSIEVAIPWTNLNKTPFDYMTLGFDLGNNDDDDIGLRDSFQVWNNVQPFALSPADFGNLQMVPAAAPNPWLSTLEVWRQQYFGSTANQGTAADAASASSDGVPNLVKYALGLNPLVADNLPKCATTVSSFSWSIATNPAANGVELWFERSTDLINWAPAPGNVTTTGSTQTFSETLTTQPIYLRLVANRLE
ncbi:MAG: sugar-binding protein [Verrucomicrobiota bacterium]|nr:sugar-binding protein [Verrucomicrobiota bacterium]